ncbi:MAG: alpha/beta hydrolase [Proteobacteria bacterium]|nr:alpha/beta hydrolase [Pseudomonadota bacterium]MBI3498143.1 alpha/beta hydrolase [Pseudomonadota bacterium]
MAEKIAWEHRTVAAEHARIALRVAGSGKTVVMLPGLGRSSDDLLPLAERVIGAGYRVALPMPRGLGASQGPMAGITLHDLAADVAAAIAALGKSPVVLVGQAFGNRVARMLAADRPELISAVVLLGASGKVAGGPELPAANERAKNPALPLAERLAAARLTMVGPGRDPTPWLDGWNEPVAKVYLAAAAATPMDEWWTAGTARVLIVQGLADVMAPPANGRMLLGELGSRGSLVELEGIGHSLPVEAPDEVAAVVIDFLRKL